MNNSQCKFLIYQSDWIGSRPYFFNTQTGASSHNVNDVIDFKNLEFDPEGLINYLDFGYSVFGKTPIKNVHFLRPNQLLYKHSNGSFEISNGEDFFASRIGMKSSENLAWEAIAKNIQNWESLQGAKKILIPTSGGFDSRILNFFCNKKNLILSRSYGVSRFQDDSFEVKYAKETSSRLGVSWAQIHLGEFHNFINNWNALYGISTHAHGMYHWEFFSKIKCREGEMPMLSGVVGDAWAGSVKTASPGQPSDLVTLAYSHNMKADSNQCLLRTSNTLRDSEFENERYFLADDRYRVLYAIRLKFILLSYLMELPRHLGFSPHSPYLDMDVALSMLNIDTFRRKDRLWQQDWMINNSLDIESANIKCSYENVLNFYAMQITPLLPLNEKLMSRLFKPEYIRWINNNIVPRESNFYLNKLFNAKFTGRFLKEVGMKNKTLTAYFAYLVLKPIELALIKAENLQNERY